MCFMGWLLELSAMISAWLTPILHNYGVPNLHLTDAIIMFLVIPFCHIMNDEETKGVISEEGWYQGIRHMLGIYIENMPQNGTQEAHHPPKQNISHSPSHNASSNNEITTTSSENKVVIRHYHSVSSLLSSQTSSFRKILPLKRRHSFPCTVKELLSISFENSKSTSSINLKK